MRLNILRGTQTVPYDLVSKDVTLLEMLTEIKTTKDATLNFASDCRSSVCLWVVCGAGQWQGGLGLYL